LGLNLDLLPRNPHGHERPLEEGFFQKVVFNAKLLSQGAKKLGQVFLISKTGQK